MPRYAPRGRDGRPRTARITDDERNAALALYQQGYGMAVVSRMVGIGYGSVHRTLTAAGIAVDQSRLDQLRAAHAARLVMTVERQLALLDLVADRAEERLYDPDASARDVQAAAVAVAIAIDKRRLIEGKSTDNIAQAVTLYLPAKRPPALASGHTPADPPSIETPLQLQAGADPLPSPDGRGGRGGHEAGESGRVAGTFSPTKGTIIDSPTPNGAEVLEAVPVRVGPTKGTDAPDGPLEG